VKQVAKVSLLVAVTLAALALAWRWRGVIVLFFSSLAVAAALRPVAERFGARGWRRRAALTATYVSTLGVVLALVLSVLDPLAENVERLSNDAAVAYAHVMETWPQGNRAEQFVAGYLPSPERFDEVVTSALGEPPQQWLMVTTVGVVGFLVDLVLVVALSLYWSFDRVGFERLWLSLLAVDNRAVARDMWRAIDDEIGAYVRSEVVQAIAAALLLGFGLQLLGHPYPALTACIGGLAWLLPWVGGLFTVLVTIALLAPAAMIGESSFGIAALAMGGFAFVVLVFLEFFVEPRMFDRRRYNSLLVVLLAIAFVELFGWFGLLVAPPAAAALQLVWEHWMSRRTDVAASEAARASSVTLHSRLRTLRADLAEAQEPRPHVLTLVARLESLADKLDDLRIGGLLRGVRILPRRGNA
jgi:putative permease